MGLRKKFENDQLTIYSLEFSHLVPIKMVVMELPFISHLFLLGSSLPVVASLYIG